MHKQRNMEVSTTDMNGQHKIKAKEELNLLKKSYPYNVSERSQNMQYMRYYHRISYTITQKEKYRLDYEQSGPAFLFFEKMKAVSRFVAAHRHPRNFLERDKKFRRIKQMNKKTYTGSKIQNHFTAYALMLFCCCQFFMKMQSHKHSNNSRNYIGNRLCIQYSIYAPE